MAEAEGFPQRFAEALEALEPSAGGISPEEIAVMLRLSREVAHRSERRWAPVASYLVGRYVEARVRAGTDPATALGEAFAVAESILPPAAPEEA
jgi:hypothetical protein